MGDGIGENPSGGSVGIPVVNVIISDSNSLNLFDLTSITPEFANNE